MSKQKQAGNHVQLGKSPDLKKLFPPHSHAEWKAAAEAGLKGALFERRLVTKTPEGIDIQPLYMEEDIRNLPHMREYPGYGTRSRSGAAAGNLRCGWEIAQETVETDPKSANIALREALTRGQTAVTVDLSQTFRNGEDPRNDDSHALHLTGVEEMADLLADVDWAACPLHFNAGASGLSVAMLLEGVAERTGRDLNTLAGSIDTDPLGQWAREGYLPMDAERAREELISMVRWAGDRAPGIQVVGAGGLVYHEAGADAVTELGLVLATAAEYLAALGENDIPISRSACRFRFTFGIGTHFFMEIAKLRAARILWSRMVEAFGGTGDDRRIRIHARTSRYHQTRYDAHVNLLRTATGVFSAVMGGADSIHAASFDESFRTPDAFSRHLARNTQIILDAESHFRNIIDPAGGAYYVERLSHEMALAAWEVFLEVESRGGMTRAVADGFVQRKVREVNARRRVDVATRRTVLVGTNQYANILEKKPDQFKPESGDGSEAVDRLKVQKENRNEPEVRKTLDLLGAVSPEERIRAGAHALISGASTGEVLSGLRSGVDETPRQDPLFPLRAAEDFEMLRDSSEAFLERTGHRPKVFLANMGPASQHKARAEFSRGFFEVAGFEVESPGGFDSPEDAAGAVLESGAPVVVLCSSDDTYPDLTGPLVTAIRVKRPDMVVVLAGYPKDHVDALRRDGVDEFIHLRANARDVLLRIQQKTGVI